MSSRRKRIVSDVATGLVTATEIRRGIVKGIEVSDLIAMDAPGPAVRSQTSTRQIAARPLRSANGTTANPAWPRLSYQTVSRPVDTMIVISETEIGTVTEGTATGTASAIAIVIGNVTVTVSAIATGIVNGTGNVIGIATLTAHLALAAMSL